MNYKKFKEDNIHKGYFSTYPTKNEFVPRPSAEHQIALNKVNG